MAREADENSNTNSNCERDQRAVLDLVGQAPQRIVAELCRLATDFGRFIAELAPPRNRSAMPFNAEAMVSPTRSAACAALAVERPPMRSSRRSSARKRWSISPISGEIAWEYPDRGNMLSPRADACGGVVVVNSRV